MNLNHKRIIMLKGTLVGAFCLADVFYLLRLIKKYNKLLKLHEYFNIQQPVNVSELVELLKNMQIGSISPLPIIVRGLIRAKSDNVDKNILSTICETPIHKTDRLNQYVYDRIPYREVLAKAFHVRPSIPKNVCFDLHDLNGLSSIPVVCGNSTDISGILSEIKTFEIADDNLSHPILSRLKSILNNILFLNPFKFTEKVGDKITYHNIMNDQFGYVMGKVRKTADGALVIENPNLVTKQIAFVVRKLKRSLVIQKYALYICLFLQFLLLYYLSKWLYKKLGLNLALLSERIEKVEENIPHNQTCIVCYTAARSVIFKPCKHYGLCTGCYKRIGEQKSCPLCKERIEGIIQIIKKP